MDSDSEMKLIALISQLPSLHDRKDPEWESKIISLVREIISLVRCMDFDSQPKPESKLMSLVSQTFNLLKSMDSDSLPAPLSKLISLFSQKVSEDSDQKSEYDLNFKSLVDKTLKLYPYPELISLIRQIVSLVISLNLGFKKLISLSPQAEGCFRGAKFLVRTNVSWGMGDDKWSCFTGNWDKFSLTGEDFTHFRCSCCGGADHREYERAPLKIKHPLLHQKHSMRLVLNWDSKTRKCYCCDEDLIKIFYYSSAFNCAMNIACVEKAPVLQLTPTKWHEHKLSLFPRRASLTCNICALADAISPIYMCPPCDFVVHLRCIKLPRLIRISRHTHRISFRPSFDRRYLFCSICREKINSDYGGFSCIQDGCAYAAHSRCATQSNVWDGIDLEGVLEEIEEDEAEPFVTISPGIIRHFSHEHHHLKLDENTTRDYDENRQCQACLTPIYFGNFYSCVQCEFLLHEKCVNLSRNIYHAIHPHRLTLALVDGNNINVVLRENKCSVCGRGFTAGFFYECGKEECIFRLHIECATIFEPLSHVSHAHPLYLTSKPGDERRCCVCLIRNKETFNCIVCDNFSLCFKCAAIPQTVRYKHDEHSLTLSYGDETSTMTYWCEACERQINPKNGFYICAEYCHVNLHIECLIGKDLYMKPGSSFFYGFKREDVRQVSVQLNDHHMSRPICSKCEKRCPHKIVIQGSHLIFCSLICCHDYHIDRTMLTRVLNAI